MVPDAVLDIWDTMESENGHSHFFYRAWILLVS